MPLLRSAHWSPALYLMIRGRRPSPPPHHPQPPPTNTPGPVLTPDAAVSTPVTQTRTTLTVWIPPEIWAASESGQATFNAQLNAYRAEHPDLDIQVEPKASTGQGGILSYLLTGRTIAPGALPDLVALPADQLTAATTDSLVYALDDTITASYLEDMYPAGLTLATVGEKMMGYPFFLTQPPHLAYDSTIFTTTVPLTWTEFIALPDQHLAFAAGGLPGATLLLEMYLDNGGLLMNEAGQVELQVEPLAAALQQISDGRTTGFILPQSSNMQTLEDSWQAFQSGQGSFVQTTANQYLRQRDAARPFSPALIPGREEPLSPLVSGWVWAISTPDVAKRPLTADLLTFLIENENLGQWSHQSRFLPARQGAFFYWPTDDPYVPFISDQLLAADAQPFPPTHPVMVALTNAVFDVVSLAKSPQLAAEAAVAALNP
ncbi:MAG: extracellular solute-binding protein [Anaerolineae bacterium]|nr:extracellular solute-binding protein [Anaerolineae bacterium]